MAPVRHGESGAWGQRWPGRQRRPGTGGGLSNLSGGAVVSRRRTIQADGSQQLHQQSGDRWWRRRRWRRQSRRQGRRRRQRRCQGRRRRRRSGNWRCRRQWRFGNSGQGGGLFDAGTASFTGIVVNFRANAVVAGLGGDGGSGGEADGGGGGNGGQNGTGGNSGLAQSGGGGRGGNGSTGRGGGILVATTGALILKPRLGTKKSRATDTITADSASMLSSGAGGLRQNHHHWRRCARRTGWRECPGRPAANGEAGVGIGGGIAIVSTPRSTTR